MKFTLAPAKIIKNGLLWHPEDINLQHSLAQSMVEMGRSGHTSEHQNVGLEKSANSQASTFLAISFLNRGKIIDHSARKKLATNWRLDN